MIKACVFLGNPGRQYARTRHNAGWMTADSMSLPEDGWQEKFSGLYQFRPTGTGRVLFLKPLTMMNLSGKSVRRAMDFYRITPQELLCVHDDLETEFGILAVKRGGGLSGHNGLKSLKQHLGTDEFYRLRIGISRPARGSVSDWVLGRFSPDEEAVLPRIVEKAAVLVQDLAGSDIIREEKLKVI